MFRFIAKASKGKIKPLKPSNEKTLEKILSESESLNKKLIITIEYVEKKVNNSQISLYRAFIIKSSEAYGCTYSHMENLLKQFHPKEEDLKTNIPIEKWTSKQLDSFINQASEVLSSNNENFKF